MEMLPNKHNCFVFHQTKNVDEEFKADGFADVTSTHKYEFEEETEAAEGLATTPKSERPLPKCQRQRKDLQQKVKKSKPKDQVSFYSGKVEISKVESYYLVSFILGKLECPIFRNSFLLSIRL
jgi:hypothetical protein